MKIRCEYCEIMFVPKRAFAKFCCENHRKYFSKQKQNDDLKAYREFAEKAILKMGYLMNDLVKIPAKENGLEVLLDKIKREVDVFRAEAKAVIQREEIAKLRMSHAHDEIEKITSKLKS